MEDLDIAKMFGCLKHHDDSETVIIQKSYIDLQLSFYFPHEQSRYKKQPELLI